MNDVSFSLKNWVLKKKNAISEKMKNKKNKDQDTPGKNDITQVVDLRNFYGGVNGKKKAK